MQGLKQTLKCVRGQRGEKGYREREGGWRRQALARGKEGAVGLAGGLHLPLPDYFGHGWIMTGLQEVRAQREWKWTSRGVISSLCSLPRAGFPGPGLANMGRVWGGTT